MAKFPGTEMDVLEKYTDSWRLDQPDFADVAKTTFAKGTITDFEKVSDDPIKVKSRVKVDIGGDEWLPLVFHSKKEYWDPDSQKYNEGSGYFEKAWMSFRVGDEVAVMLKEETPVAVLAFADGVPRIGEDIVKFETATPQNWQMSLRSTYGSENGPDGLALKLELDAELIKEDSDPDEITIESIPTYVRASCTLQVVETDINISTPFIWQQGSRYSYRIPTIWTGIHTKLKSRDKYQIHLYKVGPILYLIAALFTEYRLVEENNTSEGWSSWYDYYAQEWISCSIYDYKNYPGWTLNHYDNCATLVPVPSERVAYLNSLYPITNDPPDLGEHDPTSVTFRIYAAIYTEDLYNDTKNNPPVWDFESDTLEPEPPAGFVYQTELNNNIAYQNPKVESEVGMKYHVRPHTKTELQAAGMWPAT